MNFKYKVLKFKKNKFENTDDLISIEEPLEISLKYKDQNKWLTNSLIITMRTPGHDEDLVRGFLYLDCVYSQTWHYPSVCLPY